MQKGKKFTLANTLSLSTKVEYALGWNHYMMKFIGIWPENRSLNQTSSYKVIVPVLTMLCFCCAPQSANLPFILDDFDLVVENLSMGNITISISLLKTIVFWSTGGRKYINFHMTEILASILYQCNA